MKTVQQACEGWKEAVARNQRFWNGTATEEDEAEMRDWLAGGGLERALAGPRAAMLSFDEWKAQNNRGTDG